MTGDPRATTPSERATAFTQGVQVGVDAHAIERELADLWRHSNDDAPPSTDAYGQRHAHGPAAIRACAWNLIVLADVEHVEAIRDTIDRLSHAVPTRTLLVTEGSPLAAPVSASVTARCQVSPSGGKLLCSEEITLEAAPSGGQHVAAIARALLVPDVPTALFAAAGARLFQGSGSAAALPAALRGLVGSVDRIVFDSARLRPGDLQATLEGSFKEIDLADVAWLRDGYLRSAIASLFDPPTGAEPLARLTHVAISHAGGVARAGLLAAFVAVQLGWRPARGGAIRTDGAPVTIALGDRGADGEVHVELRTSRGETFTLTDLGGGTLVHCDSEACRRTQLVASPSDDVLLRAALSARGRDPLYRRALAFGELASGSVP